MGHFAKVVDGKVSQVIVAEKEFFDTFVDSSPGQWLRTSYNTRGGVHYEPNSDTPKADQSQALRKTMLVLAIRMMPNVMRLSHQHHLQAGY